MNRELEDFLEDCKIRGRAKGTIVRKRIELKSLSTWMKNKELCLDAITRTDLISYLAYMKNDRGVSNVTLSTIASGIRRFFAYLAKNGRIVRDVSAGLPGPKRDAAGPFNVMTYAEVRRLLDNTVPKNPTLSRDRAILELMYSSALRRSEVAQLDVGHVDFLERKVHVYLGKGKKDRVVPVGKEAIEHLKTYYNNGRPLFRPKLGVNAMFLTKFGAQLMKYSVRDVVIRAKKRANIARQITPHTLRHSSASHLMWEGASLREISAFLGHNNLKTTTRYCHLRSLERDGRKL